MNKILAFLNIKFLVSEDSFKNWRLILFVSFLALLVIFSVHSAENKIFKIALLNEQINHDILGGAIIKVGDFQIDDSVRKQLKELKNNYNKNLFIKDF